MDGAHDLYRRWIDEFWNGKPDIVGEIVSDDFVGHWPDREVRGAGELVALIGQTHEMLTGPSFTLQVGPLVDGDLVAGRWTGQGETADGPMRFFGNDVLRVREGRFVEYWVASSAGA
ncbi:MAG: ester cyclase [Jatrophihabitans sp.]